MVHSIEVVFDDDTEAAVRRIWAELRDAGISSPAPTARPHCTLTVAQRIDDSVDAALAGVLDRFPLPCRLGATLIFGRSVGVLARLVLPTDELLALHREVYRLALPLLAPSALPHTAPGQWTPHVTLARRLPPESVRTALRIAGGPTELVGEAVGLRRWQGESRTEHRLG